MVMLISFGSFISLNKDRISSRSIFSCYIWMVGFYGISTFVGYLTPNPFYTVVSDSSMTTIMDLPKGYIN